MKYYPQLSELPVKREMIDVFRGYNHNLRIGDGEFFDMKNLTSNDFPVLSPRAARGIYATPSAVTGMVAKDTLCYVDGSDLILNGERINEIGLDPKLMPKTLINMGAYVIIMPDKKYVNTANPQKDKGSIEAFLETAGTVEFSPCTLEGADCEITICRSATDLNRFASFGDTEYCLDMTKDPPVLKQWSSSTKNLESVATTYIKIKYPGIGDYFEVYDGVKIEGVEDERLADLNNVMVVWAKGADYIVVTGIMFKFSEEEEAEAEKNKVSLTQEKKITFTRQMPEMDFIIESENRLWGCHYGMTQTGEVVNEIYASKLGDFKNWNCFMGVSTDSYAVTVGSDGPFTGAIAYKGYPIFFKEGHMHKLYGNYPANYQVITTACRGVQKGCSRSLAIVNETLLYKSRTAVCAYDGALPYEISEPLGDISYSDAVAGTLGNKYYISMRDDSGKYSLFAYDLLKGMWHKEDDTHVKDFCSCGGDLYYIEPAHNNIKSIRGSGEPETAPVEWEAITGIIGTDSPDKKYISRLDVRMSLSPGSRVYFFAQYDSVGEWELLYTSTGVTLRSFALPIRPKRCDHLRLKIVGVGDAKIYSICKTIEEGSDV